MKKLFTLLMLTSVGFITQAQTEKVIQPTHGPYSSKDKTIGKAQINDKKIYTGLERVETATPISVPPSNFFRAGLSSILGETSYDLQSNGSMKSRIVNHGNGRVSGAWTIGTGDVAGGFADRGTGYNTKNTTTNKFGASVTKKLETRRTGFTNLVAGSDGTEYIFAHGAGKNGTGIWMQRKKAGESAWTEKEIANANTNGGVLWASVAVGGANGKTIHMVALTDVGTAAAPKFYKGVVGNLLYYRSTDGGDTWDIKDQTLPTIDSTTTYGLGGDSYVVKAKGDVVAIGLFDDWGDSKVFKSTDNGATWTSDIIYDFPLVRYRNDKGYTLDDIGGFNPSAPDSLAILSTDNAGCIFIDNNNKVHAAVGRMWYADTDLSDGNSSYYPGTSGVLYWNENEKDSLYNLDLYFDANQDTVINVEPTSGGVSGFGRYYKSLTSWPTIVNDPATNDFFITYCAIAEGFTNEVTGTPRTTRHIFVSRSQDGGKSWGTPKDLINDTDLVDDNTLFLDIAECTFPQAADLVDGKLHVLFQTDEYPDLHVQFTSTEAAINNIVYVEVPLSKLTSTKNYQTLDAKAVKVFPNPTNDIVNISLNLENIDTKATLIVSDITGRTLVTHDLNIQSGTQSINLTSYPSGTYFFTVKTDRAFRTEKIVKF